MKRIVYILIGMAIIYNSGQAQKVFPDAYWWLTGEMQEKTLSGFAVPDTFYFNGWNPATGAGIKRLAIQGFLPSLSGGLSGFQVGAVFPSSGGVIAIEGFSASGVLLTNGQFTGGSVGFSKKLTEGLWIGAKLKGMGVIVTNTLGDWYLAMDIGMYAQSVSSGTGIGFFDPAFGLVMKNFGKQINIRTYDAFPNFGLGVGGSFLLVKLDAYKLRFYADALIPPQVTDATVDVAMEHIFFDMIHLKAGMNRATGGFEPYFAAIGFDGNLRAIGLDVDLYAQYQLMNRKSTTSNGSTELLHSVAISIAFGPIDRLSPKLSFSAEPKKFSPNRDWRMDKLTIRLGAQDDTMIEGWKLDIADSNGQIVKVFSSASAESNVGLKELSENMFAPKTAKKVPEMIEWDGLDANSKRVPDGEYTLRFSAWDDSGNTTRTNLTGIVVDTTPYKLRVFADGDMFSPNEDGVRETIAIRAETEGTVAAVIRSQSGTVVRTIAESEWKRRGTARVFEWNGKDDTGKEVKEGGYKIQTESSDDVGNKSYSEIQNIQLIRGYEQVGLSVSATVVSPNLDGTKDTVFFTPKVSSTNGLTSWSLTIYDGDTKPRKVWKQMGVAPKTIIWDGRGDDNTVLPDGQYYAEFAADFRSGNRPHTYVDIRDAKRDGIQICQKGKDIAVQIDTQVSQPKLTIPLEVFSPNGDGVRETLTIIVSNRQTDSSEETKISISDANGKEIAAMAQSDAKTMQFDWDGRDESGKSVPEGVYRIRATTSDDAGNRSDTEVSTVKLRRTMQTARLEALPQVFSPNSDGTADYIEFVPRLSDAEGLESWTITLKDSAGKTQNLTGGKGAIPEKVFFDGKGFDEGEYECVFQASFDSGNSPKSAAVKVNIDLTAPKVECKPEYLAFSPNGDKNQDTLPIEQKAIAGDGDVFRAVVKDSGGNPVFYEQYSKDTFPKTFQWLGLDKDLKPLPSGEYEYSVEAEDAVGNKSLTTVKGIQLKTGLEKVTLRSDTAVISPNGDGNLDEARFTAGASSTEGIVGFELDIRNAANQSVAGFSGAAFQEQAVWNGTDKENRKLSDGIYHAQLKIKYNFGDEPVSSVKTIIIDTTAPKIGFEVSGGIPAFSPNRDGRSESIVFRLTGEDEDGSVYRFAIKNASGESVVDYLWKNRPPSEIIWDGKDAKGGALDTGYYSASFQSVDKAGNAQVKEIKNIYLNRETDRAELSVSPAIFSPNGDSVSDSAMFKVTLGSTNAFKSVTLMIKDENSKVVRCFEYTSSVPEKQVWDGIGADGKVLPDGRYSAVLSAEYKTGNIAVSEVLDIVLDTLAPNASVFVTPAVFTPDGDAMNDRLAIPVKADDANSIREWSVAIYPKQRSTSTQPPLKAFTGTAATNTTLYWDGISDDNRRVESLKNYEVVFIASDKAGNKTAKKTVPFSVGVMIERISGGYKVSIPEAAFSLSDFRLKVGQSEQLDILAETISQIALSPDAYGLTKDYTIEVSIPAEIEPGETRKEAIVQRKSLSVCNFLIGKGFEMKRMKYRISGKVHGIDEDTMEIQESDAGSETVNEKVEVVIRK